MATEKEMLNRIALQTAQNFALTIAAGELLTQAVLRTEGDREEAMTAMLAAVAISMAQVELRKVDEASQAYVRTMMDGTLKPVELYAREKLGLGKPPKPVQ